jgi:hypothetical protein
MADGWTTAEKELRDALLDEIAYVLPSDQHAVMQVTLRVFDVLERLGWAKKAAAAEALTPGEIEMLDKMLGAELWVMEENQGEAHPWRGPSRQEIAEHRAAVDKWRRLNGRT